MFLLWSLFGISVPGEVQSVTPARVSGPLGGVKNLRVTDPTMTSLNVKWDPADGAVRLYKVFYVPAAGGREEMVRSFCWTLVRPLTHKS